MIHIQTNKLHYERFCVFTCVIIEWQMIRYITSDCDAVQVIHDNQGYAKSPEDAVADVLKAGMEFPILISIFLVMDSGTYTYTVNTIHTIDTSLFF